MSELMKVSSTPHVRAKDSTARIMLTVAIALLPAAGFGVWHFGWKALLLILITVATCVLSEWLFCLAVKKKNTIGDFSAVVTGMLLAMNLPVSAPWWIGVIGGVFAIVVVKMLFGGLGQNFMNPALGARCFLLISFSKIMTDFSYVVPGGADVISGATPLACLKNGDPVVVRDMILGTVQGTIGETSMLAIVFGGCILIMAGIIDMVVTGTYILSFAIFVLLFAGRGLDWYYLSAHISGGGLMLGAFFMATDYVTRPITRKGQIIYGILLGVLTGIFRLFGPSAEGVSYAIIIGNLLVPLIEKISVPAYFGKKKADTKKVN
ncbi:MAG: RnfABCDGE type electron transport complex subunit D [Lachnospiraceae bacterium]|nr:RnfABCDGE type electron transport complex subunit D [Lachnospiraceae bacterium]